MSLQKNVSVRYQRLQPPVAFVKPHITYPNLVVTAPHSLPGYCGADVKALCTEAVLVALRRRYPQIYSSSIKLQLDATSVVLRPCDFSKAMRTIVPASQRALAPPGRALSPILRPLLANSFSLVLKALLRVFPHAQCADRDIAHGAYLVCFLLPLTPWFDLRVSLKVFLLWPSLVQSGWFLAQ